MLHEGGILAITVPPTRNTIVGGHVSNWNAGLLLYHLVLAGFNCKNANILKYYYNISIIVKKNTINSVNLESLSFDTGDTRKIKPFLPNFK